MSIAEVRGDAVMHDKDGHLSVEWVVRGPILVSPHMIEEWVNTTNELRRLKKEMVDA